MWGFIIQYTQIWSVLGDTEVMGKPSKILLDYTNFIFIFHINNIDFIP